LSICKHRNPPSWDEKKRENTGKHGKKRNTTGKDGKKRSLQAQQTPTQKSNPNPKEQIFNELKILFLFS